MVECPTCKKEINELDERCPYCNTIFEDMIEETEEIKENIKIEKENEEYQEEKERTNADILNFMAVVNIIIFIVGAIIIWCNFATTEVFHKATYLREGYTETIVNWGGIIGGIAILIVGFTQFFLLKTVVDIYDKVAK